LVDGGQRGTGGGRGAKVVNGQYRIEVVYPPDTPVEHRDKKDRPEQYFCHDEAMAIRMANGILKGKRVGTVAKVWREVEELVRTVETKAE
jgi:hypothetical protein